MKRKYYIAYGSNLDVDQMLRRCPDAITIGSSTIDGYRLVFRGNSRSGVANIEPCEGGERSRWHLVYQPLGRGIPGLV